MDARKLTDEVSVSQQITLDDVRDAAAAGFKSIVCHRPDGEAADQTAYDKIAEVARTLGLEVIYQPVVSGQMTESDADAFANLIRDLPKPILAYCRTGTRCTNLWALADAPKYPLDDILKRASDAGYDVRGLAPAISARANT